MSEQNSFRLACPYCGQHLEVENDMAGMVIDCPTCGQSLIVPADDNLQNDTSAMSECCNPSDRTAPSVDGTDTCQKAIPAIKVIRKQERFVDKCMSRAKAIGIGLAVLLLFIGVGVIKEFLGEDTVATNTEAMTVSKVVAASIRCLENYIETPTDGRRQALSQSLAACPEDFQEAVKDYLSSLAKTCDDMISDRERKEAEAGTVVLGLLAGAASDNPRDAMAAGWQIGNAIQGEMQQTAQRRLEQERRYKLANLIDVAQKYGVDLNDSRSAM